MLNRANKNSCYFDKSLFKACFVSVAALVMTGKLTRNCIITNIKCKSKTAAQNSVMEQVIFGTAVADFMRLYLQPRPQEAPCCCSSFSVSPWVTLLWAHRVWAWAGDKEKGCENTRGSLLHMVRFVISSAVLWDESRGYQCDRLFGQGEGGSAACSALPFSTPLSLPRLIACTGAGFYQQTLVLLGMFNL